MQVCVTRVPRLSALTVDLRQATGFNSRQSQSHTAKARAIEVAIEAALARWPGLKSRSASIVGDTWEHDISSQPRESVMMSR